MQKITFFLLSSLLVLTGLWIGVNDQGGLSYFNFKDSKRVIASLKKKSVNEQMWEILDINTNQQVRVVTEEFKLNKKASL